MNKNVVLQLALLTLVGMPFIALVIDHFSEDSVNLAASLAGPASPLLQVLYGLLAGAVAAAIASLTISMKFMQGISSRYVNLFGQINFNRNEIVLVSLCAGVGEELLFRGALQPFMGIALTSFLFVGMHGYYSIRSWQISVYGAVMTVIIAAIGWMSVAFGLISAMVAHTVIDVVLLHRLQEAGRRKAQEEA
jgi:membrane protease YdiL (CAAX protease family)